MLRSSLSYVENALSATTSLDDFGLATIIVKGSRSLLASIGAIAPPPSPPWLRGVMIGTRLMCALGVLLALALSLLVSE